MDTNYVRPNSAPAYLGGTDKTVLSYDYIPVITQEDIDKKTIMRYLARRSNDVHGEIIEITERQYQILQNVSLYTVVRVPWRIAGRLEDVPGLYVGVLGANLLAVGNAEKKMPGIHYKLTAMLQYYQGDKDK